MKMRRLFTGICIAALAVVAVGRFLGAEEGASFRFVVMGCMHFNGSNTDDFEAAIKSMKQFDPDFALFLGSIVDTVGQRPAGGGYKPSTMQALKEGTKLSQEDVEQLWEKFDRVVAQLGVPVYDVPSERSIPANNVAVAEKSFLKRHRGRYYSFIHKNNLFILLDSEDHNRLDLRERGLIEGKQLEFLEAQLANAGRYDNTFIAMHKSVWIPGFSGESGWFDIVHPRIKGKVKNVFGACAHIIDKIKEDDVTYITSGAAPDWPGIESKQSFFHFLVVDVKGEDVSVDVVPVGPIPIENLIPARDTRKKTTSLKYRGLPPGGTEEFLPPFPEGEEKDDGTHSKARLNMPDRIEVLQIDKVTELLNIKPGMTILEIGSGTGLFAFAFADALRGTGRVFATDTHRKSIEYLEKIIRERGYRNVTAVPVRKEGLDAFYKKHLYDIVFMANLYELIKDPVSYFRELNPYLKKMTGRLYMLYYRFDSDFQAVEFGDFKKVKRTLYAEGDEFPINKRLSGETMDLLAAETGFEISEPLKKNLVDELNGMLDDRTLFHEINEYFLANNPTASRRKYMFISPRNHVLVTWLVDHLRSNGVFDPRGKAISEADRKQLRRLNRIAIIEVFKTFKLYQFFRVDRMGYFDKETITSEMRQAGYKFLNDYDFLPYHHMLEFKRKD